MSRPQRGRALMAALVERLLRRPKLVVIAWTVALAAVAPFAWRLGGVVAGGADVIPGSESDRAGKLIERHFGRGSMYPFVIVIRDTTLSVTGPAYAAAVERLTRAVSSLGPVASVESAWNSPRPELIGNDGHTALAVVTPRVRDYYEAERFTGELRRAIAASRPAPTLEVHVTGATAMLHDLDEGASSDLFAAERIGIPITLGILLIVFGAPLAALLPVVLALAAVAFGLAGLYLVRSWTPPSVFAENVVSMIGLGVGVDYALFILSRYREERSGNMPAGAAAARAVLTAGHSVAFSGATVAVGFLALLLIRAPFLRTIGVGGVFVVAIAVVAAVTLLPAMLVLFDRGVDWPRRAVAGSRGGPDAPTRPARRWAGLVTARPWAFLLSGAILLALLIIPATRLRAWNIGAPHLPRACESRRGFELIDTRFPRGWMGPIVGVIEARDGATVWAPESRRAVAAMGRELRGDARSGLVLGLPQLAGDLPAARHPVVRRIVSDDGRVALVALVTEREPGHPETMGYLRELRGRDWPALAAAGLSVRWTGSTAAMADFDDEMRRSLLLIVTIVVVLTLVVLAWMFRSVVIPLKATMLNVLCVLATYGFLVLVFQDGVGAGLLALDPPGGLNSFIMLMLFPILFGLSMDYEILLLSRVREEYESCGDNARAIAGGLGHTAGVITSAALIMVSIFTCFGFARLVPTREFGLGLAFAVVLDATVIRSVLAPAVMAVSGRWNWWWPWKR